MAAMANNPKFIAFSVAAMLSTIAAGLCASQPFAGGWGYLAASGAQVLLKTGTCTILAVYFTVAYLREAAKQNLRLSEPIEEKPKRRWLRYRIETLLIVVTLTCVWLGWRASIVPERKALLQLLQDRQCRVDRWTQTTEEPEPIAAYRKLLGDFAIARICYSDRVTYVEHQRIKRAYPEAQIRQNVFVQFID
jgi:hypothetical protein